MALAGAGSAGAMPKPGSVGVAAYHPLCSAEGSGPAAALAPRLCTAAARVLTAAGRKGVAVVAGNDAALGTAGHVVIGFALADSSIDGRPVVTVAAKLTRSDVAGGTMLPPHAALLPVKATDADLDGTARTMLHELGLAR